MSVYTKYATNNNCYKAATSMVPAGILVHSTGAENKTLKRYVNYPEVCGKNSNGNHWDVPKPEKSALHPDGQNMCVHAFIGEDKDGNVATVQILPYDYACWGCGSGARGSYNRNYIQFEICEGVATDGAYFNKAYAEAVEYCVLLCKAFGWSAKNITSHSEAAKLGYASKHSDPFDYFAKFGKTMDSLRLDVTAALSNSCPKVPTAVKQVFVATGTPAIRRSASSSSASLGRCVKSKMYPSDSIVTDTAGVLWAHHITGGYSSTKDTVTGSVILRGTGTYTLRKATSTCNVRSRADLQGSVLGQYEAGDTVVAVSNKASNADGITWQAVVYDNELCWVDKAWIK